MAITGDEGFEVGGEGGKWWRGAEVEYTAAAPPLYEYAWALTLRLILTVVLEYGDEAGGMDWKSGSWDEAEVTAGGGGGGGRN